MIENEIINEFYDVEELLKEINNNDLGLSFYEIYDYFKIIKPKSIKEEIIRNKGLKFCILVDMLIHNQFKEIETILPKEAINISDKKIDSESIERLKEVVINSYLTIKETNKGYLIDSEENIIKFDSLSRLEKLQTNSIFQEYRDKTHLKLSPKQYLKVMNEWKKKKELRCLVGVKYS